MIDLAWLPASPLLDDLAPTQVARLAAALDLVEYPAHADVLRYGEPADDGLSLLLAGTARVFRGDTTLRFVNAGGVFGELGLLYGWPRSASVEAATPLRTARLTTAAFEALRAEDPDLALTLVLALTRHVGEGLTELTGAVLPLLRGRGTARAAVLQARVAGELRTVPSGVCVQDVLPATWQGSPVVAGVVHNRPVTLNTPLFTDGDVAPITLASWEGRDVYRRSAALLLLEAARRVDPRQRVQVAQSLGSAQLVRLPGAPDGFAGAVELELRQLVALDLPISDEHWSVDEARAHFAAHGPEEMGRLLTVWRTTTVRLARAGETLALYSGPLLTSAKRLGPFRVEEAKGGLVLDHHELLGPWMLQPGDEHAEPVALERRAPRFGAPMTLEHGAWLGALGLGSVGAYNERCIQRKDAELIRAAEGFHEKHIGRLADRIAERRGQLRVIAVAGPSSSGKTTFIRRLTVQLQVNGVRTVGVGLDDYYRVRDDVPLGPDGKPDFEAWGAIDGPLVRAQVTKLVAGRPTRVSKYSFLTGRGDPEGGPTLQLGDGDVLLVEGIHGLNPLLLEGLLPPSAVFRIFVHPVTTLPFDRLAMFSPADLRLLRRIVRDRHHRGSDAADTIRRWPAVRRGERLHIYPQLPFADAVFDSALVYEPSVLKLFAEQYLLEVGRDDPGYPTAYRLRHLLDRFVALYPDPVPSTSILREFIGNSGFDT